MALRERDLLVDLESGVTTGKDGNKEPSAGVKQTKKLLGRVLNGFASFEGAINGEDGTSLVGTPSSADVYLKNTELLTDNKSSEEEPLVLGEKKVVKEKRKKRSAKKPPRPPRGPSLDAADMKLVREISELAMLKRARIERMKALKKMKAAKATSSTSSLCAMVITILFFLVIVFQGLCSKSSSGVSSQGSPESTVGLITIQFNKNRSSGDANGTSARSPKFMDQVAGSHTGKEESRGAGQKVKS